MIDIRKVDLSIPYRVICIADIHGNYTAFKRLLELVGNIGMGRSVRRRYLCAQ